MPALVKSALQHIQSAVEAARVSKQTQNLPREALYEAWKLQSSEPELIAGDWRHGATADTWNSPLAEWLRSQGLGVRLEGPPSFRDAMHYDAVGGAQALSVPSSAWHAGTQRPETLQFRIADLQDFNKKAKVFSGGDPWATKDQEGWPARPPKWAAYSNSYEARDLAPGLSDLLLQIMREERPTPTWAELAADPALRGRFNTSVYAPSDSAFHQNPLVLAKARGGSVAAP